MSKETLWKISRKPGELLLKATFYKITRMSGSLKPSAQYQNWMPVMHSWKRKTKFVPWCAIISIIYLNFCPHHHSRGRLSISRLVSNQESRWAAFPLRPTSQLTSVRHTVTHTKQTAASRHSWHSRTDSFNHVFVRRWKEIGVLVWALSGHTAVASIIFSTWLHVSRQEGN